MSAAHSKSEFQDAGPLESKSAEKDALASLEDRIRRAVELVASLRAERDEAVEKLKLATANRYEVNSERDEALAERDQALEERDVARKAAEVTAAEVEKLRDELDGLRSERKQVRTRIEKLLGQMDLLAQQ